MRGQLRNTRRGWQAILVLVLAASVCGCSNAERSESTGTSGAESAGTDSGDGGSSESTITNGGASIAVSVTGSSDPPDPGGWGDLKLSFIYDGDPPPRQTLDVSKEPFCSSNPPRSETLVVNSGNRGIRNVIVSLYLRRGEQPPQPHPSYDEQAGASVVLDNRQCRFEPHVLSIRTGQTLVIKNSDRVGHNTKIDSRNNPPINPLIPPGEAFEQIIAAAEQQPVPVQCSIHPWMNGRLVISDHPYVGISDENGEVLLEKVPTGVWTFQLRHADTVYLRSVDVHGTNTDNRGTVAVAIHPEMNDLGEIKVPASLLQY